jgi:ribonuclease R
MARRLKTTPKAPSRLPTQEELMVFLAEHPGEAGKREIARAFKLTGGDKIVLKRMLKEMEVEGVVERRGKKLHQPGTLPNVVLADVTGRDRDGELLAKPVEWDEEHGATPVILVTLGRRGKGERAPGVGDRALLRVEPSHDEGPAYTGRVIKVISKVSTRVLGVYRALAAGGGQLEPVDKKKLGSFLDIPAGEEGEARDGDLVAVDVLREGRFGRPKARVRERLGSLKSEKAISLIAIETHGIPSVFPQAVMDEADAARPATLKGREDWRKLPLITIDPADAKDHDDAVHAEPDTDPENEGGHIVTVAIADVAAYVQAGSRLDDEALKRGNSVYFPDRVVPMLPERISNDLCSLRPREDRPAMAVRMVIGKDGRKISHSFHRIMMRSAAKLAYAQAQNAIDGATDEVTDGLVDPILKPLWAAYASVKKARDKREPLDLDLPERKIILNAEGGVDRVIVPPRLDAHRLIEEFMILANVAAAETLTAKKVPLVFRVHDEPSPEKLAVLREVLASLGIDLPKQENFRPSHFNRILARVAGTENAPIVNEIVLRSQAQAEYAADNYGHFGLNLRRYAHFTSPIRRYADLIVHRALIRAVGFGDDGLPAHMTTEALNEIGAQISAAERRAMAAERETVDRLIAHHLADSIGSDFTGRVSGVTRSGLFVVLADTGASGFIPAATLGNDYFAHDEGRQMLVGSRTGEAYRLGDTVEVRLVEAAPVAGALRFEILSEGRYVKPSGDSRRGKQRERGNARAASKTGGKAKAKSPRRR